jgi:hypothetical protein
MSSASALSIRALFQQRIPGDEALLPPLQLFDSCPDSLQLRGSPVTKHPVWTLGPERHCVERPPDVPLGWRVVHARNPSAEGRLPLPDAAELFGHWKNITNGERMNYWLSVLAQNALLLDNINRIVTT